MIKNIRHTGIVVKNLTESISFYTGTLGFTICKSMDERGSYIDAVLGINNVDVTTVKMESPDCQMIELLFFKGKQNEKEIIDIDRIGLTHFAVTVENLSETYSILRKQGIIFISEPQFSPDGFAKVAFCLDPNGVYIEMVEELKSKK